MSHDYRDDAEVPRRVVGIGPFAASLLLLTGMLLATVALLLFDRFRRWDAPEPHNPLATLREISPALPLNADEVEAVDLFKKLKPTVVNVDIVQQQRVSWDNRVLEQQTGTGSGFIWDDEGRIVTNYHVIADHYRNRNSIVRVTLADRSSWDTIVVGKAEEYDLAVLQFAPHSRPSAERLRKIDLGSANDLEVGRKVFAIGNPLGLNLSMTQGIVSALDRSIRSPVGTPIAGGIQHSAAINPGNSGGPLLDKAGRLIGVNTAIATTDGTGGNIGIGFAIPAELVNEVVTQVIQTGRVLRPDLGIKLFDQLTLRRARYDHGVMVEAIIPGGPADKAGVIGIRVNPRTRRVEQVGDLILAINGEPVNSHEDFEQALRKLKPGDKAKLKIVRKDVEQEIDVMVGAA